MKGLKGKTVIVACGVGRDSTAMLMGMHARSLRPDAILFADVGAEKRQTYEYIPILQRWLKRAKFPPLTIVRYVPVRRTTPYRTIEGDMAMNCVLPGIVFGRGTCTNKWKIDPQNKWTKEWPLAQEAWARGEKVVKLIGYDAGETKRLAKADAKAHAGRFQRDRERYEVRYPLMEWGWNLQRCLDEIAERSVPAPVKSACMFCPNQQPWEVVELLSPEERARVMRIELAAEPYNKSIRGLWRQPRKHDGRPGSITEFILEQGLKFMDLAKLERKDPMPMSSHCGKYKRGYSFQPPHVGPLLSEIVKEYGYDVPDRGVCICEELSPEEEDEFHSDLIDAL